MEEVNKEKIIISAQTAVLKAYEASQTSGQKIIYIMSSSEKDRQKEK